MFSNGNCGDRHFVVLKATNGAYAEIRDGPSPHSSWEFIPSVLLRFNRVALLTSRSPIRIEDLTLVDGLVGSQVSGVWSSVYCSV